MPLSLRLLIRHITSVDYHLLARHDTIHASRTLKVFMKKTAIIQLAGKQHFVTEGDVIVVDANLGKAGDTITASDVLLSNDGKAIQVGSPLVSKASVKLTITDQGKGDKISVMKYKSKSRYRRQMGHRQDQTTLEVTKIAL